jgi:lipoprotein-anchoring transpeptidase ErfK/SrfK
VTSRFQRGAFLRGLAVESVFPESPEARELKTKLVLPPGPNNPMGVAWISLDKPGYGIHGTPSPEQVGRRN